ncbi:MAG TPA: NAD(P)/FAD-dependent oxidoreductase [Blastocatellia bacterium]|jgi:phytoene dehydrogenase-like protein
MQTVKHDSEVIVIGGGVAGLASATYIARAGRRVRLLEQANTIGGRARTTERGGFYLNLGPHALYRGGRGAEVLADLGVRVSGRPPSVSGAYAIKDGAKHMFPTGVVSMLATGLFNLPAKLEAARVLGSFQKIEPEPLMEVSLLDWLDTEISQPSVREFVSAAMRIATYTNAPELISAGVAISQLKLAQGSGVLYLDGGWQSLVDGLRESARLAGVEIETGVKVELIERDAAGAVRAVRLKDGRALETQAAVVASSPQVAVDLLERGDQTSLAPWAEESIPVRAACLDIALHRLPRPKALYAFGIDRPLYMSVHSASARLAPEGSALIHVAKYLPPEPGDSPETVERELEQLLDMVQPGWRAEVAHRRFLPDMIVMNAMPLASRGGARGRPAARVEDVEGLFVAGDWVGGEGLLVDASLASAREAAREVTSHAGAAVAAAR